MRHARHKQQVIISCMEKPKFDPKKHYEAIQTTIKNMEREDNIPFDVDTETVTVTVNKSALDFLRLYEEVNLGSASLEHLLELFVAEGITAIVEDIDGKPDHLIYHVETIETQDDDVKW